MLGFIIIPEDTKMIKITEKKKKSLCSESIHSSYGDRK